MTPEITQTQISPLPQLRRKWKARLWAIVIILAVLAGGFIWIRNLYRENQLANTALSVQEAVRAELESCDSILAAGEGQFDEYEYCKTFVSVFSTYR